MTTIEEIIIIANKIADQGKKPSIALIKAQLKQAVALPTIISVLNSWQHQPSKTITEPVTQKQTKAINSAHNSENDNSVSLLIEHIIEQALKPVYQELNEIKTLIKQLNKN